MSGPVVLIDADTLAFACAVVLQPEDYFNGRYIDNMVEEILEACETDTPPILFLSGSDNFRYEIARLKPYKGDRPPKPYHLLNAQVYIQNRYSTYTSVGCEADDLLAMSMTQYRKDDIPCILASIDKDLRQVEGWHYGWETHNSPEKPLYFVDDLGHLKGTYKEKVSEKTGKTSYPFDKISGDGFLWFMAQTIMGDQTDNIPGIPLKGAKFAYEALKDCTSKQEALSVVINAYQDKYAEAYEEELTEQAELLFMIRERDKSSKDGLKHWSMEYAKESASH